ncbi:aquaporin [Paracrocinitomix mangrovi]|uniref:MIP/aquaporin family protein n=1 Tax=Paracrocinitomix mangrovi TaxID=2862509 RepID=UPI001C8D3AC2|nr:aquaporin [Paracrocinitomix mangrovi]UKN00928.1 aquaporin [Paracrocinitomix mangrovi]
MRIILGEFIGTFILVFIGCGSIAFATYVYPISLPVIASIWGLAVFTGIMSSAKLSSAHLNPAVTLAFVGLKKTGTKEIPLYFLGQILGSFLAAILLFILIQSNISDAWTFESARMFGEYYGSEPSTDFEIFPFMAEFGGTFLLMLGILIITSFKYKSELPSVAFLIGVLLTVLIIVFAPYSQAGFNPARDFIPRLVSYLQGCDFAFDYNNLAWLTVYILAPILGAIVGAIIYMLIKKSKKNPAQN